MALNIGANDVANNMGPAVGGRVLTVGMAVLIAAVCESAGAILAGGACEKRPVVNGDTLDIATMMTGTLSCDHRVVDGAVGASWLQAFKGLVENPMAMLL